MRFLVFLFLVAGFVRADDWHRFLGPEGRGHTTADMANGPVQRISPFPETIELLESLGSKNNNNCVSCE